ncbi:MAG: SE1561 family protein [Ectobacillus sp.]
MGKPIYDKDSQLVYLKERLNMFIEVIDTMEPEEVELEDIDRLLSMLDELESKCEQFKNRGEELV